MKIETVGIETLSPDPANVRKHGQRNMDAIKASLRRFGQQKPIVVDAKGIVLAGNGTLAAARELGWRDIQIVRTELTGSQATAFGIADNRSAELAEWDEKLADVLASLKAEDFPLEEIGFDLDELEALKPEVKSDADAEPQIDKAEELRAKWGVELGQVWELGEHRITCGDSTSAEVVKRLLGEEKPHLMVTDPPYGVEYDASWRAEAGVNKNTGKLGKVLNDDRADWRETWALFPGEVTYVWHASLFTREVLESLEACGFNHRSMIIWAKDRFTLGRGHYHWQHEPCWYCVKNGGSGHWNGDRSQSTVWNIKAREDSGVGHSTQKPIECMERPIRNNSKPGELVYEPFSGSGTTIIACERTGRKCRAIELNPAYVAVAIQRWADATGKEPRKL
jgi:DNA modification methylase